jgi:hypothetical protein
LVRLFFSLCRFFFLTLPFPLVEITGKKGIGLPFTTGTPPAPPHRSIYETAPSFSPASVSASDQLSSPSSDPSLPARTSSSSSDTDLQERPSSSSSSDLPDSSLLELPSLPQPSADSPLVLPDPSLATSFSSPSTPPVPPSPSPSLPAPTWSPDTNEDPFLHLAVHRKYQVTSHGDPVEFVTKTTSLMWLMANCHLFFPSSSSSAFSSSLSTLPLSRSSSFTTPSGSPSPSLFSSPSLASVSASASPSSSSSALAFRNYVRFLIQRGGKSYVNAVNQDGWNALMIAARHIALLPSGASEALLGKAPPLPALFSFFLCPHVSSFKKEV